MTEETVIGASGIPKAWGCLLVHTGLAELRKKNQGKPYQELGKLSRPIPSSFTPSAHPTLCGPCCLLGSHSVQSRSKHWT